jgi:hypothetical protein
MPIELTTRLVPIPGIFHPFPISPLGLLSPLGGKWTGHGFNQIFRPQQIGSDNFLELNLTDETLEFTEIPGEIPNRGSAQPDVSLFGLTYLQQVADSIVKDTDGHPAGIHIEPGIWLNIPATTDPGEPHTVARLANIPHGTSLLAQGTALGLSGPPGFPPVSITPFFINPADPDDDSARNRFASQDLVNPSPFRSPPSDIVGVTQAMVDNPNVFLDAALAGKIINSHTRIEISTESSAATTPNGGGGIADIAFLNGIGTPPTPNARVRRMDATFWISHFSDGAGSGTLLQYSQIVFLDFNGLSWPHVSVASLVKQSTKSVIKDKIELKEGIKEIIDTKSFKLEIKELEFPLPHYPPIPDPGPLRAGHVMAAPAEGRHFITADERPEVADATMKEIPERQRREADSSSERE